MKVGVRVLYVTAAGEQIPAVVTAVTGTGPVTIYKRLDLRLSDGRDVADVPHIGDGEKGVGGFWTAPLSDGTLEVPSDLPEMLVAVEPAPEEREVPTVELAAEEAAGDDEDDATPVARSRRRR